MSQESNIIDKINQISIKNYKLLEEIIETLKKKINDRRKIMYSDIINLIIREGYKGKNYSELILWCNYKIRLGKSYIEFD